MHIHLRDISRGTDVVVITFCTPASYPSPRPRTVASNETFDFSLLPSTELRVGGLVGFALLSKVSYITIYQIFSIKNFSDGNYVGYG